MLIYQNQGRIRNQPLSPQLAQALGFLADMGIEARVFSGGQPAIGSGGARTGSTRHDHGNAADVFFYRDGQRLDWSNPEHVPVFQDIVRRGRAAGLTGFGAGPGYMQPGSMHVGFGAPAVWGAGGSSANAPAWLREAYHGSQQGGAVPVPARADTGGSMGLLTDYFASARQSESGGNDAARNPLSTATGRYQFLTGTWSDLMRRHPQLGLTPDGRTDPAQQERAMQAFTADNMAHLQRAGIDATPGTLYAAHFLGAGGASNVLRQPDSARMSDIVSQSVISANPHLRNMTVGDFRAWANRQGSRSGGGPSPAVASRATASTQGAADMPTSGLLGGATQPTQPPQGATASERRRWYQDPAVWEALQLGFNSMTLRPDPNLAGAISARQGRRSEKEEQEAQRAQQAMTREQAVGFLRQNGAPDHLVRAVEQGLVPPEAAVQVILSPPEQTRGIAVGGNVVNPVTGEMIFQGPESGQHELITGDDAAALGLNPDRAYNRGPDGRFYEIGGGGTAVTTNVNTGSNMGPLRAGERYNPETGGIEEIPGGEAERERVSQERETRAYGRFASNQIGPLLRDARLALEQISTADLPDNVVARAGGRYVLGTAPHRFERLLSTIKNSLAAINIVDLRQTGTTVGQVPQSQWDAFSQLAGYLEQDIDLPTLRDTLMDVQVTMLETLQMLPDDSIGRVARREMEALSEAIEEITGASPEQAAAAAGQGDQSSVPQHGPITAEIVRTLPDADLLTVDVMRLDDAGLAEYERRMGITRR